MPSQRNARPLNTRFIVRGFLAALVLVALALTGLLFLPGEVKGRLLYYWLISQPADPTPPPPTILAPRGDLPAGPVGLVELAQYRGGAGYFVGSGFLLQLDAGPVVGVTTAHSLDLANPGHVLEEVAFSLSGQPAALVVFDTLYGASGVPRSSSNLAVDYALLQMPDPFPALDPNLILHPDPRGMPLPGERVMLFSGVGDGQGGPRALAGTVHSTASAGVWVLMDELFEAGGLSGSPLLSQHTGQVVGMAVAATYRRGHTVLGFHPIGSIVQHAEEASTFPKISEYRR